MISAGLVRLACERLSKVGYLKPLQTGTEQGDSDVKMVEKYVRHEAARRLVSKELYSWAQPLSPHVTAESEGNAPSDEAFVQAVTEYLAATPADLTLIETAGGVLSPAASRTLQADLYARIGQSAVLVADGKLGGISTTLTSLEALERRGFRVSAIAMLEEDRILGNAEFLTGYWRDGKVVRFGDVPTDVTVPLDDWFASNEASFSILLSELV